MSDKKRVIALGFFDGVHRGHAALIEKAIELSKELDAVPSVLTFDIPPADMINGENIKMINSSYDRRIIVKNKFGVDDMIVLHFDRSLMQMSWDDFIRKIAEEFNAAGFVAGFDFRFGYKGQGDTEKLKAICEDIGIACAIVPQVQIDGEKVSSTYIRQLLLDGKLMTANKFLGHNYFLSGVVCSGHRLGRTIGAPTINMKYADNVLVPAHGVYAAKAILDDGRIFTAVTNIGIRPTVSGDNTVSVESNLLDFSENIYGMFVKLEFYKFIRDEMKFSSVEELAEQIHRDTETVRKYFEEISK